MLFQHWLWRQGMLGKIACSVYSCVSDNLLPSSIVYGLHNKQHSVYKMPGMIDRTRYNFFSRFLWRGRQKGQNTNYIRDGMWIQWLWISCSVSGEGCCKVGTYAFKLEKDTRRHLCTNLSCTHIFDGKYNNHFTLNVLKVDRRPCILRRHR